MSRLKQGVKSLGLLALMLCATAFVTGTAGAETVASWKVKGVNVTAELSPALSVQEIEGKDATLLTKISGIKVEVLCTTLQPISVKLKPEGVVSFESQLKYTGCVTKLNEKLSGACEPLNEGKEPGVIKSKLLKGLLLLHEGSSIVRFEPTEGETIGLIETSPECSIGEKISLIGKLTLKDSALGTEAETHLVTQGPLTEMWVISKTEEHKVTIDGSMIVKLAGVHLGLLWSGTVTEPTSAWFVKGAEVTSTLLPIVAVKEIESSDATLLTKIAGTKVEVLCTGAQLTGLKLEAKGAITTGSQVKFSGCLTKLNEKVSGVCEPSNEGVEPGAIASKSLKGSLTTHEGTNIVRFEPTTGETVAVIESSKECSIGEKISLLGKFTLKDASLSTEAETHLVSEGPLTELWALSKTEEHKVTLDGSAVTRLGSTHTGLLWSGSGPKAPAPTPAWRVKGVNVTAALAPTMGVQEIEGKDATLLTKILGIKVEVLCTALQPIGVKLEPEGVVSFESQLKYTGCVTKLNEKLSGACEPLSEGKEPGVIKSKLLKGVLVLHESAGIVRFEPTSGETLATLEMGEECSIGEKVSLIGKMTLKDSALSTEAETHLVAQGLLTEMWAISKTEEHKVTIDGSMIVKLAGAHLGLLWSGTVPGEKKEEKKEEPKEGIGWNVKKAEVTEKLLPTLQIKEVEGKDLILLSKMFGLKVEVLCTGAELIGFKLITKGRLSTGGKIKFSGCLTKISEKTSVLCEPHNGAEKGVFLTKGLKGEIFLNEKTGLIKIEPETLETIANIVLTEECPIGEELKLIGKLTLKDSELKVAIINHLVSEGALTELWFNTKTVEHKVVIDGSAILKLTGEHEGLVWNGIPE